jgi:hypothetical protein
MNWLSSGGVEADIIDELCQEPIESRSIDPGHKFLQVCFDTMKQEKAERGKDGTCGSRQTLAFAVGGRYEFELKSFEAGQDGEASDHRLG